MDRAEAPTLLWDFAATSRFDFHSLDTRVWPRRTSGCLRQVGKYRLVHQIGKGGMGEVWFARCVDDSESPYAAVKLLAGLHADEDKQRELFDREVRISMLMRHGTIVRAMARGDDEGQPYMVLEWVDGMNLGKLMKAMSEAGSAFSLRVTAYIIGQILIGLDYAHSMRLDNGQQGVIHRDISPQNILISNFGEVKIADFGVARAVSEETSGIARGKLGYLAPEQLSGGKLDGRVDLYAVGILLHELADGCRFRQARDHSHMYSMVMSGELAPLRRTTLPEELARLREGLLQPDPAKRIASAAEARECLGKWPGYGDASLELRRVISQFSGVDAPRSGFHAVASASASASASHPAATDPGAETRTATSRQSEGQPTREALPAVAVREEGRAVSGRSRAWVPFAGLGAMGLGAVLAFSSLSAPDEAPALAVLAAAQTAEPAAEVVQADAAKPLAQPNESRFEPAAPEPAPAAGPAAEPESEQAPVQAAKAAGNGVPESAPIAVERPLEPQPAPAKPKATKPGVIDLHAGPYNFAHIKVGGRRLLLEPSERGIKLKPGKHRVSVSFELDGHGGYESAGSITVDPGQRYELRLKKPLALSFRAKR